MPEGLARGIALGLYGSGGFLWVSAPRRPHEHGSCDPDSLDTRCHSRTPVSPRSVGVWAHLLFADRGGSPALEPSGFLQRVRVASRLTVTVGGYPLGSDASTLLRLPSFFRQGRGLVAPKNSPGLRRDQWCLSPCQGHFATATDVIRRARLGTGKGGRREIREAGGAGAGTVQGGGRTHLTASTP